MQPSRCARASSGLAVCGGCPYRHQASGGGLRPSGAPRAAAAPSHGENVGKEGADPLPSRRPSSGAGARGAGPQRRRRGKELPYGGDAVLGQRRWSPVLEGTPVRAQLRSCRPRVAAVIPEPLRRA